MARRIGFKNISVAKLTSDTDSQPCYQEYVKVPGAISLKTSDEYGEYTFYSDDAIEESGKKLVKSEIEIEVGYITNELKATLTGIKYDPESGKTYKNANATQPIFALAYEMPKSNGKSDLRVIYKCTFSIEESESTTIEDGIESNNFVIKGTAVPLTSNGNLDMEISTDDDAEGAETVIESFFRTVQV